MRVRWVQCSCFHKERSGRENIGTWRQGITEVLDGRFWCLSRYTESSCSSLIFASLVDPVCKQISLWTLCVSKYPCLCKQRSMHLSPRARHAWLYLNLTRLCFSTGLFGCWFASSRFPSFLPVLIHHRLPHRARPSSHPISFSCACVVASYRFLSSSPCCRSWHRILNACECKRCFRSSTRTMLCSYISPHLDWQSCSLCFSWSFQVCWLVLSLSLYMDVHIYDSVSVRQSFLHSRHAHSRVHRRGHD